MSSGAVLPTRETRAVFHNKLVPAPSWKAAKPAGHCILQRHSIGEGGVKGAPLGIAVMVAGGEKGGGACTFREKDGGIGRLTKALTKFVCIGYLRWCVWGTVPNVFSKLKAVKLIRVRKKLKRRWCVCENYRVRGSTRICFWRDNQTHTLTLS